jgi:hypothetical protein
MNLYEKTVAQIEGKDPKSKYVISRIPLTEKAEKAFGLYEYKKSQKADSNHRRVIEDEKKRNQKFIEFEYVYYYEDPTESEQARESEALKHSIESLNRFRNVPLTYGVDYEVTVKKVNLK